MIKKFLYLIFIALILFRIGVALGCSYYNKPYFGFDQSGKLVYIEPGSSLEKICKLLYTEKIVSNQRLFKGFIWFRGKANMIRAGEYYFQRGSSLANVYNKLVEGKVHLHSLTIPEGLDLMDIADIFQKNNICTKDEFLKLASETQYITETAPNVENLEGFLFPDTYYYARGVKANELMRMMQQRFINVMASLIDKSEDVNTIEMESQFKTVILASLIEKETSIPEEMPLISSVFHNRLRKNIPLQCDPTIIYALKRENRFDGNLKRIHLKLNSPYNTYVYSGLPPGPICNPGFASLRSALHPAQSDYLYFVSKNDGSHHFSRSLREHNQAVYKYQKLYWRLKWRKERELTN